MTRLGVAIALAAVALLAAPAAAVDADAVAERLAEDPVLVDQRSAIRIDEDAVLEAVEAAPVPTYVLILPQSDVDRDESGIDGVLLRVVEALNDPRAVVVVVSDVGELQAGEGGSSGVEASLLLDRIVQSRDATAFNGQALTAALVEFAQAVGRTGEEGAERGITGSGRRTVGVAGLIGVLLVGGGLLWFRSQRQVSGQAPPGDPEGASGAW
jgi:hypothetical protein